jgi:hypothetical protein
VENLRLKLLSSSNLTQPPNLKIITCKLLWKLERLLQFRQLVHPLKLHLPKEAIVSKRGSVVISKGLISELGFAEGDKFAVRKTKAGISLKKL